MDDKEVATVEPAAAPSHDDGEAVKEQGGEAKAADTSEKEVKHKSIRTALRANLRKASVLDVPKPEKVATSEPKPTEAPQPTTPRPAWLKPEEHDHWEKTTPEGRNILTRREGELRAEGHRLMQQIQQKEQQIAQKERAFQELSALEPVREEYARQGIQVTDIVRRAVAWDKAFKADPLSAAREYLDAYGIDPSELANGAPARQQAPQIDESKFITREQFEQMRREEQQRNQQANTVQTLHSVIENFKASKPVLRDEQLGAMLEPIIAVNVDAVRASNPGLSPAEILDAAWTETTRNPHVAELLSKFSARDAAAKAQRDADASRAATRSVTGGPGTGTPKKQFKTTGEALRYYATR